MEQNDAYVRAYVSPHACAVMPWGGGLMYSELGVGWCSYDASTGYVFIQCVTGGGGIRDQVVWRASTGVVHCVFDQIPNLQNCFTTPNKNLEGRGPQKDKHLEGFVSL